MNKHHQPTPPIITIEIPPLAMDMDTLSDHRKNEFLTWNKIWWLAVLGFGTLCAVAAYQIVSTGLFIKAHS
jgi:hypothetical protein